MWRSILLLLLLPTSDALAFKPAPPKRHDVFSPNGKFVLDVDPNAKQISVFAADKRDQPLWSFKNWAWSGHHLSNDGKVVAILHWEFVSVKDLDEGVCVTFLNEAGKLKEHRFADLCPHPRRLWMEPGPVGSFWRKWYTSASDAEDTLTVCTTDEYEYVFAMEDGHILERRRVGLPWWSAWAILVAALGGAAVLVVWRFRRARKAVQAGGPHPPITQ